MTETKKPLETAEAVSENSICESCGEAFSCGANLGECWCFAVEVRAEILAELREDFENCLCQNCLEKLEKNVCR